MANAVHICVQEQACAPPSAPGLSTLRTLVLCVAGAGCFDATIISPEITRGQLFGWEVVMTFTLISVVYACGVAKPGHGSFTPLAVGLSLVACAGTGKGYKRECCAAGPLIAAGTATATCWQSMRTTRVAA
jgi:hypothetical protein